MNKILLIIGLGCVCFTQLLAQEPLDQIVSLQLEQQPLANAFYQLIDNYDVKLSFRNELLPKGQYTFYFAQRPLREVLDNLLKDSGLNYRILGDQIVLVALPPPIPPPDFFVSGFVKDKETGEMLIGANVYDRYSQRGTVSNEFGFFCISLPAGKMLLRASYLGYQTAEQTLDLTANVTLSLELKGSITLSEVIVYARDTSANPIGGLATGNLLGLRETKLLPSLAGEPDIIRTAYLLPGVTTGADGSEGLQIRGSDAGQNLVLLDGVPVYYVNHAIGLFSIFNSNAILSAQLLRGGFPARYGGRLASILDIRMKEGNQQTFHGSAEAGLLTTRFSLEGPVVNNRSSFFVSGRWSFIQGILRAESQKYKQARGRNGATEYRFFDINAKFNYTFSEKDRVFLSLYNGKDRYDDLTTSTNPLSVIDRNGTLLNFVYDQSFGEGLNWGNTIGGLRWNHLFSDQLFANFSLTYSRLDQESYYNIQDFLIEPSINFRDSVTIEGLFRSGIQDLGLKADWQLISSSQQVFRFGLGANHRLFKPGALIVAEPIPGEGAFQNNTIKTSELTTYVEGQGWLSPKWEWNAGTHLSWWHVRSRGHLSVQPRISTDYHLLPSLTFNASFSRMVQNLHFLRNTTVNLPTEIWVPSTDQIRPANAWLGTVGYRYEINETWRLQGDLYYKKMNHLLAFLEGVEGFKDWEKNVTAGQGEAYGSELQLSKVQGRLTGWLSYTLAKSVRQFEELNLARIFPFRYDRRHNLQLAAVFQIKSGVYFSANWGYSSGFALTLPLVKFSSIVPGQLPGPDGIPFAIDPEAKNNIRMPAYHRLDVNFHREWPTANGYLHTLKLGVYNVYNRNNPLYYDIRSFLVNQEGVLSTQYSFVEVQLAPILPTISYQFRF